MKKTDLAWLAGLVNGEGCISAIPKGTIHLQISMCDVWCLHRAVVMFPDTHLSPWICRPGQTAYRRWGVTGKRAIRILTMIKPWLSPVKVADWEYAKKRAPHSGEGNYAVRVVGKRKHCPRGHPYDTLNTYVYTGSHGRQRHCKTCKKLDRKAWYDRNKHTKFWLKYRAPRQPRL